MKRALFLPLVLAVLLTSLIISGTPHAKEVSQVARPEPLHSLPISIVNNRVNFTLYSGAEPVTFLLDTGATSSIYFQPSLLHSQPYETVSKARVAFPAIDTSAVGERVSALSFTYGDFTFTSKGGLVIGAETGVSTLLEAEYDAILGQEFFRAYTVEVDPENNRMHLYAPGTDLSAFHRNSHRLYMEGHTPHIRFYSKLPWENRTTSKALLLDTGYPGSLVIWHKRHFREATSNGQLVSRHDDSAGIVSHIKLKFGQLDFENIPIFIAKDIPFQAQDRDGLIGASILAQHKHVIDFAQARLFLTPIYGPTGEPLQIMDGMIYTPNNEAFDLKTYYPEIPKYPTLIIHPNGDVRVQ